jgi:matrixin
MTPKVTHVVFVAALLVAVGSILADNPRAYTLTGAKWNRTPIDYYINTTNLDLPGAAVEAAVRAGADSWAQQSNANFAFHYAGASGLTTNTLDSVNVVMFRNASSGQAIATTYYWSNSSGLLDADIVFWDAAFQFFTGTTGCSGGFYIEDIAAHEFGHALGMGHSTSTAATMFPSVSSCNQSNRVLDADDLSGVLALYGPRGGAVPGSPKGLRVTTQEP